MQELPERLKRTTIYESEWINLYVDRVKLPSGRILEKYHQIDFPKASVMTLLVNRKGDLLLVRNRRYSTGRLEWSLVGGYLERGESVLECSKREILEETGYAVENLIRLPYLNFNIGMSNNETCFLIGKILEDSRRAFDTDEVKEIKWVSKKEAQGLIKSGEMRDGLAVALISIYLSGILDNEFCK